MNRRGAILSLLMFGRLDLTGSIRTNAQSFKLTALTFKLADIPFVVEYKDERIELSAKDIMSALRSKS